MDRSGLNAVLLQNIRLLVYLSATTDLDMNMSLLCLLLEAFGMFRVSNPRKQLIFPGR